MHPYFYFLAVKKMPIVLSLHSLCTAICTLTTVTAIAIDQSRLSMLSAMNGDEEVL